MKTDVDKRDQGDGFLVVGIIDSIVTIAMVVIAVFWLGSLFGLL